MTSVASVVPECSFFRARVVDHSRTDAQLHRRAVGQVAGDQVAGRFRVVSSTRCSGATA